MGVVVSSSHIVSATPSSSHSAHAPPWGPSHGRQYSTNYSSVGPFHGVQTFRDRLLQPVSPVRSQALPANLRQCRSPQVHRSCQEPAPAQASHGVTASFGCTHLHCCGVLHGLWVEICSSVGLHGLQGTACLTIVCSMGCKGISAPAPGAPPPPPSALILVSAELFLSRVLTPLSCCKCLMQGFSPA